jgi:hypothetical protein
MQYPMQNSDAVSDASDETKRMIIVADIDVVAVADIDSLQLLQCGGPSISLISSSIQQQ